MDSFKLHPHHNQRAAQTRNPMSIMIRNFVENAPTSGKKKLAREEIPALMPLDRPPNGPPASYLQMLKSHSVQNHPGKTMCYSVRQGGTRGRGDNPLCARHPTF